jgi:hypothetical protein
LHLLENGRSTVTLQPPKISLENKYQYGSWMPEILLFFPLNSIWYVDVDICDNSTTLLSYGWMMKGMDDERDG